MNNEIEQIIVRNLSGEASFEDIVALAEWLTVSEENKELFFKIKKYWHAKVSPIQVNDSLKSYNQLLEKMPEINSSANSTTSRRWVKNLSIAVAAMLTGVFVFWAVTTSTPPVQEYVYISGESVAKINLPDGTKVSLNKNSRFCYSSLYGKENRDVSLEGEAYFEVKKDRAKQFVVNTSDIKVTALGTTFNVQNYAENELLSVTLVEGSVRMENSEQSILLQPNQQLFYHKMNKQINMGAIDTNLFSSWKDPLIRYQSVCFEELCVKLENLYDVEIIILNAQLKNQVVSGSFERELSVDQILTILRKSLSLKWTKEGNIYTIQ